MDQSYTVVLTNFKRPGNVKLIHRALQGYRNPPPLYLWDNNPFENEVAALSWTVYAKSNHNRFCLPRWHLAKMAETPFVAVMDDDLLPANEEVLVNALGAIGDEVGAVGLTGVQLNPEFAYKNCKHFTAGGRRDTDIVVDIIKGRFVLFRTEDILRFNPKSPTSEDIEASAHLRKRGRLILPKAISGEFQLLDEGGCSLHRREGHYDERERVRRVMYQ